MGNRKFPALIQEMHGCVGKVTNVISAQQITARGHRTFNKPIMYWAFVGLDERSSMLYRNQ
jgi:hypothetical protein